MLVPVESLRAARATHNRDGTPTQAGLDALAALEATTQQGIRDFRHKQRDKALKSVLGGVLIFGFLCLIFSPVARESPPIYWTGLVVSLAGVGALVVASWRGCRQKAREHEAVALNRQRLTVEQWKRIAAMSSDEFARQMRHSEQMDKAGRLIRRFAGPAAAFSRTAAKAVLTGDLSDALDIAEYVDGSR